MNSYYDDIYDDGFDSHDEIDDETDTQLGDFDCDDTAEKWGSIRKLAAIPAVGYLIYVGYQVYTTRAAFGGEHFMIHVFLLMIAMWILGVSGSDDEASYSSSSDSWNDNDPSERQQQQDEEDRQQRALEDFCSKGP